MTAVAKFQEPQQPTLPAIPEAPAQQITMMDIINRAIFDPTVDADKVERLGNMALAFKAADAKAAYTRALVAMKPKLPVIDRKGRIEVREKSASGKRDGEITQNTPYARWEDIDEAITPILAEHGFVLTHRSGTAPDGKILITGVLSHEGGHSEETTMALPHDSSGSKNAVQAVGSSTHYGKRYTAGLLLNIRTRGQDDDGQAGGDPPTISDGDKKTLQELIDAYSEHGAAIAGVLQYFKVGEISDLTPGQYRKAVEMLNTKYAGKKKATKQ